jgi:hypothetical protein
MFRNPYYAGRVIDPWTKKEYVGRHVPMVSPENFARVQMILDRRRNSVPHRRVRDDFPVRGLVRCSSCAWPLTSAWTKGRYKRYGYYECQQRSCPARRRSCRAADVHGEFVSFLGEVGLRLGHGPALIKTLTAVAQEQNATSQNALTRCQERIATIERRQRELLTLRLDRQVSDDEFKRVHDHLRRDLLEAQASMPDLSSQMLSEREGAFLVHSLSDLPNRWQELDGDGKQAFGRLLFPRGYEFQRTRTAEKGLLFSVLEGFQSSHSQVVHHALTNSNALLAQIRRFLAIVSGPVQPQNKAA